MATPTHAYSVFIPGQKNREVLRELLEFRLRMFIPGESGFRDLHDIAAETHRLFDCSRKSNIPPGKPERLFGIGSGSTLPGNPAGSPSGLFVFSLLDLAILTEHLRNRSGSRQLKMKAGDFASHFQKDDCLASAQGEPEIRVAYDCRSVEGICLC